MPFAPTPNPRPALALLALVAAGCSISQPEVPMSRWLAGDYAAVRAFAEAEVEEGYAENLAIVLNVRGQSELAMGDLEPARRSFERAGQIMGTWAVSGGEVAGAILGSESSKTYKGDPYEKAMNAFYLAYCLLERGEPDNARAALKRGILADGEVADETFQVDNALLFWMAGRMSRLAGQSETEDFFGEARTAHAFALEHGARGRPDEPLLADPDAGNLVLVLPVGLGPQKYADGGQDELARFRPQSHPAAFAEASLDGRSLGRSAILCDVDYQAMTLGGTAMEGIRKGKAVFKTATTVAGGVLLSEALRNRNRSGDTARTQAIVGGSLLLLGLLTSTAADTRHWPTLPSTVQVLTADVPPGEHTLTVDFFDAGGRPLPALRHVLPVRVPEVGESWHLVPSLPQAAALRPEP